MTKQEYRDQIMLHANTARAGGQTVTRETRIDDTITVYRGPDDEYVFMYKEARDLFREAHRAANTFGVDWEDYILHIAQGW